MIMILVLIPLAALYIVSILVAWSLRSYSRSLLEQMCRRAGTPELALQIVQSDRRTEQSAVRLAGVVRLTLIALGVLSLTEVPIRLQESSVGFALLCGVLVLVGSIQFAAGVWGKVFAETLLVRYWSWTGIVRNLAWPLDRIASTAEGLVRHWGRSMPRPASVEVEFATPNGNGEHPEQSDPEIPKSTREILEHAVELTHRQVSEVMVPRSQIVDLPISATLAEVVQVFRSNSKSRVPLYGENRDDILGVLHAKDFFLRIAEIDDLDQVIPRDLIRDAMQVPESKNANQLLSEFLHGRRKMAIVHDQDTGVVIGLVTLEDLLRKLFGEIRDEHETSESDKPEPVQQEGPETFNVLGGLPIEDLNERLDLQLPTDREFQTVSGLAYSALGHEPTPKEQFQFAGLKFTVLEVSDHAVKRLQLVRPPTHGTADDPEKNHKDLQTDDPDPG